MRDILRRLGQMLTMLMVVLFAIPGLPLVLTWRLFLRMKPALKSGEVFTQGCELLHAAWIIEPRAQHYFATSATSQTGQWIFIMVKRQGSNEPMSTAEWANLAVQQVEAGWGDELD